MKIARIDSLPVLVPFADRGADGVPAWRERSDYRALETLFVRVETDDGIVGWGEAFSYNCMDAVKAALDHMVAPLALGRDARHGARLMHDLHRSLHLYGRSGVVCFALSGLDIALWDIAGKRAGLPLSDLLGGRARADIPAYASLFRHADPARVAADAASCVAQGYRRVKVHTRGTADIVATRQAIGASVTLMADTNCAWTVEEARAQTPVLRAQDLLWLEEPLYPPDGFAALADLQRDSGISLAAGENCCLATDIARLIASGAVRYVQPSVTKLGGITEFRKAASLTEAAGLTLAPHSPYFGPGFAATLHLMSALAQDCFIEDFRIDLEALPYGDALRQKGGRIAVPSGPGLGIDPDADYLKTYRRGAGTD